MATVQSAELVDFIIGGGGPQVEKFLKSTSVVLQKAGKPSNGDSVVELLFFAMASTT
jgi:hypothetical protein